MPASLLIPLPPVLSGVFTDVEASLKEIKDVLDEDVAQEQKLREALGKLPQQQQESPPGTAHPSSSSSSSLVEVAKEWAKYMEVHEKASFTNTELHKAMNLHISNLRLLSGPLEQVKAALPAPSLTEGEGCLLGSVPLPCSLDHLRPCLPRALFGVHSTPRSSVAHSLLGG